MASESRSLQISTAPVTMFAHLIVIAVATLLLVWLLAKQEGFAFKSHNKLKIFDVSFLSRLLHFIFSAMCIFLSKFVFFFFFSFRLQLHPLFMIIGFILIGGEGKGNAYSFTK